MPATGEGKNEARHATLAAAFVAAQRRMQNPTKSHTAKLGQYSYAYASLDDTLGVVKAALNAEGVAVHQATFAEDGIVGVRTVLTHESGEAWDMGQLSMPAPSDPQKLGALLTYMRRYALSAAAGVAAEEDDDAVSVGPVEPPKPHARQEKPITEAQRKMLHALARERGIERDAMVTLMQEMFGKEHSPDLTSGEASQLIDHLRSLEADPFYAKD